MKKTDRIETFAKLLGKATAKLASTDKAAADALVRAGQALVAEMKAGRL